VSAGWVILAVAIAAWCPLPVIARRRCRELKQARELEDGTR
jgi:hypothetical protein